MSGQTMTTRQLAELCEVDERTVRRWIVAASDKMPGLSDKMSEAEATKKPAHYHLNEVLAIINAGGKHTLASLLAENAKQAPAVAPVKQLPAALSGSLVRELRVTMGPALATKIILAVAGIPDAFKPVQPQLVLDAPEPTKTVLRFPSLFSLKYPVDHYTAAVALALIPARVEALVKSLGIEGHLEALTMRDLVAVWSLDKGNRYSFKTVDDVEDMARNIDASRGVAS